MTVALKREVPKEMIDSLLGKALRGRLQKSKIRRREGLKTSRVREDTARHWLAQVRCLGRVFGAGLVGFLQMIFDTDFGQFLPSAGRARTRSRLLQSSVALVMLVACSKVLGAQSQMSDTNPDPIDVGVLAVLGGEDTRKQWQPLLEGLSQALPHRQLSFTRWLQRTWRVIWGLRAWI